MEIIRSNYSTLSKIAQDEAPAAPEYPFTDIMTAYRDNLQHFEINQDPTRIDTEEDTNDTPSSSDGKPVGAPQSNQTMSFQRILKHFFDDYFQRDADDETSADMAQRWVAFARTGDPNYEDSKIQWVPWRYIPEVSRGDQVDPLDGIVLEDEFWKDAIPDSSWEDDEEKLGRALRDRALQALNMEVVEEDILRTELRRIKTTKPDPDNPFFSLKLLSNFAMTTTREENLDSHPKELARQTQRVAQEMGVLGTGLRGDDRAGGVFQTNQQSNWDDDFFPQLLELMWPPEGRLVERDCTCDLWDRIRCKHQRINVSDVAFLLHFAHQL